MTPSDADAATAALLADWGLLCAVLEAGRARRGDGASLLHSGLQHAYLNQVVAWRGDADPAEIAELLQELAGLGAPYSLSARPSAAGSAASVAAARGMRPDEAVPLMVLTKLEAPAPAELDIRVLSPAEAGLHAEVAAAGFAVETGFFVQLVPRPCSRRRVSGPTSARCVASPSRPP